MSSPLSTTGSTSPSSMASPERTSRKQSFDDPLGEAQLLNTHAHEQGPNKRWEKKPRGIIPYATVELAKKGVRMRYKEYKDQFVGSGATVDELNRAWVEKQAEEERYLEQAAVKYGLPQKPVKKHHDISTLPKKPKELSRLFPHCGLKKLPNGHPIPALLRMLQEHWTKQHEEALDDWKYDIRQVLDCKIEIRRELEKPERSESEETASQNEEASEQVSPGAHTSPSSPLDSHLVSMLERSEDFDDLFEESEAEPDTAWGEEISARMEVLVLSPMEELLNDPLAQRIMNDSNALHVEWAMKGPCIPHLSEAESEAFLASLVSEMP